MTTQTGSLQALLLAATADPGGQVQTPTPAGPALRPTIKRCSFTHDALAQWMIENPSSNLGDAAEHFGYTRGWLSCIIHSDAFQARYKELLDKADVVVIHDIPAKLRGIASQALEGLAAEVEVASTLGGAQNRTFLKETSDMVLRRLGYGESKTSINVNNTSGGDVNVGVVSGDALSRARTRLQTVRSQEARVIESEPAGPDTPST